MIEYNRLKLNFEKIQNEIEVNGHEISKEKLEIKRKDMKVIISEIQEELESTKIAHRNLEELA